MILSVWANVFTKKNYLVIALSIACIFYVINALIVEWQNLHLIHLIGIETILFSGLYSSVLPSTFIFIIIMSLLTGMLVTLLIYRYTLYKSPEKKDVLSALGIFLGFFVTGCAACGVGLAALLGIGSSIAFLPFKGTEIAILAILLLTLSIIQISLRLVSCTVPLNGSNSRVRGRRQDPR